MNKRWVSIGVLLTAGATLATACGSEDDKKKTPPSKYNAGGDDSGGSSAQGDGGGDALGGTGNTGNTGGAAPNGGMTGEAGSLMTGDAGSGMTGDAGMTSSGGGGGAPPTDPCPDGFDDCDDDPSDCETPVNTLTQCGGCDISCSDDHGSVACTDSKCVMTSCTTGYGDCDEDGTTGCELALAEDDAHCGDCLRDCAAAGSTCNTSMCAPVVVEAVGSGFLSFLAGKSLYLMNSGAMPVSSYTLSLIPLDGGTKKQIWAASANVGNGALWADDTDVYWAVSGTPPSVLKKAASAATDDLPAVVFQPTAQPHYLTAQGVNFYWASNATGFIYARAKSAPSGNGTAIMSVDQGNYTAFETTPTTIYWVASLNGPELRMAPLGGGSPTPVPDAVVAAGAPLFVTGEKLYFIRRVGQNALNGIYSYSAGDLTVKQLVAGDNIGAVIADDRGIYYKLNGDYHVYKAKLTGSAGVAIATSVYGGQFTGQDDTFIYQIYPWGSSGAAQAIIK